MNCYICEISSVTGQCHDCGGFYCSEHGVPRYCAFCALRHDELEPLRRALTCDIWLGFRQGGIEKAEAVAKRSLYEKAIQRLLGMLHDPDYMLRYRVVYVLSIPYRRDPYFGGPLVDEPLDARIMEALAHAVYENRNYAVRGIALDALKGYYEYYTYYGHPERARGRLPLIREHLCKAWIENKMHTNSGVDEARAWSLLCNVTKMEKPGEAKDILQEIQNEWEKYVHLDMAVKVILAPLDLEVIRDPSDRGLVWGERVKRAKKMLASASKEDVKVCLRRLYYKSGRCASDNLFEHAEFSCKRWSQKWASIKGSILEESWMEADLPTSEEEDRQTWERPRERLHVAENMYDPIYKMVRWIPW